MCDASSSLCWKWKIKCRTRRTPAQSIAGFFQWKQLKPAFLLIKVRGIHHSELNCKGSTFIWVHNNLSATTGYHPTHIHDIAYPAHIKSAAPLHIVCIYVYIRCITFIDNCKYVLKSTLCVLSICMCILHIVFCISLYCLYVNCFCTVWSKLSSISLTKAHVLWWYDNKRDLKNRSNSMCSYS